MAKILTDIGQCAVKSNGVDYVFTPSFLNLSQLGDGSQIVRIFNYITDSMSSAELSLYADAKITAVRLSSSATLALSSAIDVLSACCDIELPESLVGGWVQDKKRIKGVMYKLSDREFGMPPSDIMLIAYALLKDGLIGDADAKSNSGDASSDGFQISSFINFAVAHFGMNRNDASNMTMKEFQRIYDMKFPELKKRKEDREDAMEAEDFYEKIRQERARRGLNG